MSLKILLVFQLYFCLLTNVRSNLNWDLIPSECDLTNNCRIEKVKKIIDASGFERIVGKDTYGMICDIKKDFGFNFNISAIQNNTQKSSCLEKRNNDSDYEIVELRWPKSDKSTFENSLNISNLYEFIYKFWKEFGINLVNIKRFGCNISDAYCFECVDIKKKQMYNIMKVLCSNCKFDYYIDEKTLKTCEDFIDSNVTDIQSIFQMRKLKHDWDKHNNIYYFKDFINLTIVNGDFRDSLCPLIFNDSMIDFLQIIGMVDSFYKRNFVNFFNHSFKNLTSSIKRLELNKIENINLDLKLLNADVFKEIKKIYNFGSINRIDEEIFKTFEELYLISFKTNYFRKIMHRNGIKWIRAINSNVSVNVSDANEIWNNYWLIKTISLDCFRYSQEESMSAVFPDEDFCLYVDYPFQQLVLLIQLCGYDIYDRISKPEYHNFWVNQEFSCTYTWLIQFYPSYNTYYYNKVAYGVIEPNWMESDFDYLNNLDRPSLSSKYILAISECNFTLMKSRCDKSKYSVSDIWGLYDYSVLNKKLEIVFKISSYLFSFLGIFTNLKIIITILHKDNTELFKGLKQYDYLCYNSIFSMLILAIQMLSWMTECFYPYEVFCPEIRKLVFIQVFKMVFKECFITAFRFMCNFTYVAFALNRISLIGKDHGRLVQFVSEVGTKPFIIVCLLISCGGSVVKYFKYEINYDQPESSYPILIDHDLTSIYRTKISNDGVIIANSIFDILNYVVFEVIIFIIDIYMVVLLRRILEEKMKKTESLIGKKNLEKLESLKKENDDAINKVIKMVILNTAISVLFRLPIAFIPTVNVAAEFYYKNYINQFDHPMFGEFYWFLLNSGFYDMIIECSNLFYNFSLFIQLFIYNYFDKKFKIGLGKPLVQKNTTKNRPI